MTITGFTLHGDRARAFAAESAANAAKTLWGGDDFDITSTSSDELNDILGAARTAGVLEGPAIEVFADWSEAEEGIYLSFTMHVPCERGGEKHTLYLSTTGGEPGQIGQEKGRGVEGVVTFLEFAELDLDSAWRNLAAYVSQATVSDEDRAVPRVPVVTVYSDFEWTVDPEGGATVVYATADGDEICGCGYVITPSDEGGWYHRDGGAADDHTPEP